MASRRRKPNPLKPPDEATVPEPFNIPEPPVTEEQRQQEHLLNWLFLAGESLAGPLRVSSALPPTTFAASENSLSDQEADFRWLHEITALIQQKIAEDSRRAELLRQAVELFSAPFSLEALRRNVLLPAPRVLPVQSDGALVLTEAEIAVLREAARDYSHEQIAERLKISPRTVSTHFTHIYGKLGVNRPMQAVGRAIVLGYLELDALELVGLIANDSAHIFSRIDSGPEIFQYSPLTNLAHFGLALFALVGAAGTPLQRDTMYAGHPGLVCEVDTCGKVLRRFGAGELFMPTAIAIAPPQAAQEGFTPGNLFVGHLNIPYGGLNFGAVSEFTPDMQYVRTFSGAKTETENLDIPTHLFFTPDGRLLVSSGGDMIALTQGGKTAYRFAIGPYAQVMASQGGQIWGARRTSFNSIVKVFDSEGNLLRTVGGVLGPAGYDGIAFDSQEHFYILWHEGQDKRVDVFDTAGVHLHSFAAPARSLHSCLVIDAEDRLYICCRESHEVQVFSTDGTLLRQVNLRGILSPFALTVQKNGNLWVCGTVA